MGSVGDLYRITMKQILLGETMLNVFWYLASGTGIDVDDLLATFKVNVAEEVVKVQGSQVESIEVFGENINDAQNEYGTLTLTVDGQLTGSILPKMMAWGFKLNGQTRTTKAGGKRFGGGIEEWITLGVADPLKAGDFTTLGNALAATLTPVSGAIYKPCIARITGTLVPGYTVAATNLVGTVVFNGVTTQNTRKN